MDFSARTQHLLQALENRILVLDGAMGTAIQALNLSADDFGGPDMEGCNEHLVLTRPDLITQIHESHLEAGADIIETNSFGGTPLVLREYGLHTRCYDINSQAARLAQSAARKASTHEKPRFVAGSMGPTTKAISVTGGITFWELVDHYYEQACGLFDGGVDYFLLETCQDTRNIKAALLAIDRLFAEKGERIPIAVSATIEMNGTMLAGQGVDALMVSLEHVDLLYIGLNCSSGPQFMTDHIRSLAKGAETRVACVPNAGLPDANGNYPDTPEMMGRVLAQFCANGWINLLGGCCGTRSAHIRELSRLAREFLPRKIPKTTVSRLSGIDVVDVTDETRPILVGERTNIIGSRAFKRLICNEQFDEASDIARLQVKNGAQIIDICLSTPDRDEKGDMIRFLSEVIKKIKIPLMIDSTDETVIQEALTFSQGKAIINSINLEHGEERFQKIIPLAKAFGAALVVGTIDEDKTEGMAVTRERKLEIAKRAHRLLTGTYGFPERDIYFDCLVFPCGTGDLKYRNSAKETVEAIRLIKNMFPKCHTVLGISNVSFGLPDRGREVLNSIFLHHAIQAGLDLPIVNTEKLERYTSLSEEEKELSENLLFPQSQEKSQAALERFTEFFRTQQKKKSPIADDTSVEKRLMRAIVEGTKERLPENLDEALRTYTALDIINGPLMKGMNEVGRLFSSNEMIVAEVLMSAEVMNAAVSHLQPHLSTHKGNKGTIILCTVKGDVHDIGKNLVDIIFANNGYTVIDLGIKVSPEQIIEAVRRHHPDIIGLSGLLVKSAFQMVDTVKDLAAAQITTPVLVGGAALSRQFTNQRIAPSYPKGFVVYSRDAVSGLELANTITDPSRFKKLQADIRKEQGVQAAAPEREADLPIPQICPSGIEIVQKPPEAPDFERHILTNTPLEEIFSFVNLKMLFGKHLGIKGRQLELMESGQILKNRDSKNETARKTYEIALNQLSRYRDHILQPRAIYQFFRASSEENRLVIMNDRGDIIEQFDFPRQKEKAGLCLSDFVRPQEKGATPKDNLCIFVTTVGNQLRAEAERLKTGGEYLQSHILHALSLALAEGYAELLHARLRELWGFPDPPELKTIERFQAHYRGKRYSPGYPACPNLDDQKKIWRLLKPEEIGVTLTERMMMDPESSVSAFVFHHPQARHFAV